MLPSDACFFGRIDLFMNEAKDIDIDRRELEQKRFRMDTGVNIAHILTTIGMLVMLFSWGSGLNATDTRHTTEITNLKEDRLLARADLMVALQEINRKLDKIQSERRVGR